MMILASSVTTHFTKENSSNLSDDISSNMKPGAMLMSRISSLDSTISYSSFLSSASDNLSTTSVKSGGRLPGLCTFNIVKYESSFYAIVTIQHKKSDIQFVIDCENISKVITRPWHLSSGKYIATTETSVDGTTKEIYLHNFLKKNIYDEEENSKHIVHINHNLLDNRNENLRIVDSSEFQQCKTKRKRKITLPADCGFVADDIPKYISYLKANGDHGDRFVIEIPKLNILRKLTSSKKVSLKEKLVEAKEILNKIYEEYPEINPNKEDELINSLNDSFQKILVSKVYDYS